MEKDLLIPKLSKDYNQVLTNKDKNLKEIIKKDSLLLHTKKPSEKYRQPRIEIPYSFPIKNFIDFQVSHKDKKLKLQNYLWLPKDDDKEEDYKALVISVPGLTGHSNNLAIVADSLVASGCVVASFDFRGHGYSDGDHGYVDDYNNFISDILLFLEKTKEFLTDKFSKQKKSNFLDNVFMVGISFGAAMTSLLTIRNKNLVKGIVLLAPAFDLYMSCFNRLLIKSVSCIRPGFVIPQVNSESVNYKNPENHENPDPLFACITVNSVNQLLLISKEIKQNKKACQTPLVIVIPGCDKVCPATEMYDFYEQASSEDKEVWYYPNLWHSIYGEEEIFDIRKKIVDWIDRKLKK